MSGYERISVEVPVGLADHLQALISHLDRTARLALETSKSAVDLDANRFIASQRELEIAQRHRGSLVILVQIAWASALEES